MLPEPAVDTHRKHNFIVLLLLGLIAVASSDELDLLLTLKTSLSESKTKVFDSWNSNNSICDFTGITCDDTFSSVKEIELSNQNLVGSIPFDSICQLNSLQKLSFGFNNLHGFVTQDLNKCSKLTYLDLGNNFFSGSVPDISSMNQLLYLYVNSSGFTGAFPWAALENMTHLVALSVGDNPFNQTNQFPNEVLKLTRLNWLYMSNCSIGGEIPAGIGELTELKNLEMSMNYLTGEIPKEITKLKNLWQLELFNNNLTGKLPVGLGNLTNLEFFDASTNFLQGDLNEVKSLSKLKSLQLFENELVGVFPPEIGEFKDLVNLSLYRNKLTGTLPKQLGSWSDFNFIDVSENFLTGEIPPDMCKNGVMTELLILQNNFTGQIPRSYSDCKTLTRFRVSDNMLSGVVPNGIWGLPKAEIIDIANNFLEGSITSDIQNAKTLGQIFAAHNRLSGELVPEITKANSLVMIDLSHNDFSGKVPEKIGELKQLGSLHLDNNRFTGEIPKSLRSCDSLGDINMAYNLFSGRIPEDLGWLPTLNTLNLSSNQLSGHIPESLSSLRLSLLDLSHNRLAGPIPGSLSIEAYNGSFSGNPGLCSQNVKYFQKCSSDMGSISPVIRTLITCLSVGSAVVLVLLAYLCYVKSKSQGDDESRALKDESWNVRSFHVLSFMEDDILKAIKDENMIGKGGSGQVYRVSLKNGVDLAVKHIMNSDLGKQRKYFNKQKSLEFDAEVETLSSIRHVNVVKLYCSITSEDSSLLVYEYMPNGSLWDRLHTTKKLGLDWETRYEIALGAAKGLEYLHHGCERPVIHRDVKSSNILLDEHLKPRIADFGLAKIVQTDTSNGSTHVIAGTHGYIAPEYGYTYKVNEKSDVYSFGVVLMELVTGKKPIEFEYGENKDLVYWVYSKLKNKESVLSLVDSSIPEPYKEETIKVLKVAIMCTSKLPTLRPTMRNVVKMLKEAEPCKFLTIIVSKDDSKKETEKV
uniref:receptor-like protein kinase 7 n=1 Tax=Erigeron canadensis TaxID=72917 RepID=UPI001CB98AC2|nr:receptor-like protein kinase 7 [Erigeron canadensis]